VCSIKKEAEGEQVNTIAVFRIDATIPLATNIRFERKRVIHEKVELERYLRLQVIVKILREWQAVLK